MGLTWPQLPHRAGRSWQGGHHGSPVSREVPQGRCSPQTEQVSAGSGGQPGHSGPCGLRVFTTRRRPQFTQTSRLAGSLTRQFAHTGIPRASRAAGSLTLPHLEQGRARDLATQVRHSQRPSIGRCKAMTRPHCGHGGRMILVAPASQSLPISRSTDGTGVSAPAPVSRAGRSCSAQASWWRLPAWEAAAFTAAATIPGGRAGSMAETILATVSTGSGPPGPHRVHRGRPSRSRECTRPMLPQRGAGQPDRAADAAVPVLAAALLGPQGLAALSAVPGARSPLLPP